MTAPDETRRWQKVESMEPLIGGDGAAADLNLIKESDTANFAADVIEASKEIPVIVDFWAPWCGPCKQLTPAIEKAVRGARGQVKLVKINVDDNQELAGQLRVQSIPTVFAFKDGQPVDGFVGALPESQIKTFIQKLGGDAGPSELDQALDQADEALAAGDHATAGNVYSQVLRAEPTEARAAGGLVRAMLAGGDVDGARKILDSLDEALAASNEVEGARAAVELAEQTSGGDAGEIEPLRQKVAANEKDHQARFDLAVALFGAAQREQAVDELLEIIRRDRGWNDEAARKQLLKFFDAMGPTDPLTVDSRRALSSILFS